MRVINKASIIFFLIDNFNKSPLNKGIIKCNGKHVPYLKKNDGYYVFLNLEENHYEFDFSCAGFMPEHYSIDLDGKEPMRVVIPFNYKLDNMLIYNMNKIVFNLKDNGIPLKNADVRIKLDTKVPFLKVIEPIKKGSNQIKINSDFNSKLMFQEYYYSKSPDFKVMFSSYDRKNLAYENEISADKEIAKDGLLYPVWNFKTDNRGSFVLPKNPIFMLKGESDFTLTVNNKEIKAKSENLSTENINIDISKK